MSSRPSTPGRVRDGPSPGPVSRAAGAGADAGLPVVVVAGPDDGAVARAAGAELAAGEGDAGADARAGEAAGAAAGWAGAAAGAGAGAAVGARTGCVSTFGGAVRSTAAGRSAATGRSTGAGRSIGIGATTGGVGVGASSRAGCGVGVGTGSGVRCGVGVGTFTASFGVSTGGTGTGTGTGGGVTVRSIDGDDGASGTGRSTLGVDGRRVRGGTTDDGRSGRSRISGALRLSAGAASTGGSCCGGATAGAGCEGGAAGAREARRGGGVGAAAGAGGRSEVCGAFCSFDSASRFISAAASRLDSMPGARISPVPVTDDIGRKRTPKGCDDDSPNDDDPRSPDVLPNSTIRNACSRSESRTKRPSAGSSWGPRAADANGDHRYLVTKGAALGVRKTMRSHSLPHEVVTNLEGVSTDRRVSTLFATGQRSGDPSRPPVRNARRSKCSRSPC